MSRGLASTQLIDCFGQVTHTLVLEPDGRVRVRCADRTDVTIDPRTGTIIPAGRTIPEHVIAAARDLAPW